MTDVEVYAEPRQVLERLTPEQVRYIANTEIIPKNLRGRPEAIMATILKGRSLGLDDINALSAIHFIEGKAGLSAETMVHLVRKRGHSIIWEAVPGESCTVVGTRKDNGDTGSVTWTMGMAKDAGLASKDVWKRYPDAMLFARAGSQLCRMLFADVLMGTSYSPDELEEIAERGRVTEAVSDLPILDEVTVRTEPASMPSEAQMNRIAALEERSGDGYKLVLRGVFGVEMASELDADAAGRYEATLAMAVPPQDSAEDPSGNDSATDGVAEAVDEAGSDASEVSSSSAELPGEPAPEDEVVEGDVVEESDDRLVEIAGETVIPNGNYSGTMLKDIHDGWISFALQPANRARLPVPFVQALDVWVQARKPELWEKAKS